MERGYRTSQCMTILSLTENINIFVTFVWKSVPKKRSHNDKFEKKWKIKESDDYIKSVNRYFRELAVYFSWIYLSKTSVQNISVV